MSVDYTERKLREREQPEPAKPAGDEVLFRVLEVGVCGTDRELASFRFGRGPAGDDFLVLGHEAVGQVLQVGEDVTGFAPGDLVVPSVRRACVPACPSCARNRRDLCLSGGYSERGIFGAHGYFTERASDRAGDLLRLDASMRETAVLLEPLSVVEKAVMLALSLHRGRPETALVLGAGTVGLLTACILRLRGLQVDIVSIEPPQSGRARLAGFAEAEYRNKPARQADIVIEAAGAPEAAETGLRALAPLGVMVVLGAFSTTGPAPLQDLIVGNQILAGSVNASPEAFAQGAADLALLPRQLTSGLIERTGFGDFQRTLAGPPEDTPKLVHVIG